MVAQPYVYIDPPRVAPYKHGLFSVATELKLDDDHWEYGGVEWESLACYRSAFYPGGLNDVNGAGGTKVLPACMGVTQANAFAIYGGVKTGSLGHGEDNHQYWYDRARAIVEGNAQWAVENALWTGTAGAGNGLNSAGTPKVVAGQGNTVDNAVDLVSAIGLGAAWLANNYAGRGVIHAPRALASVAAYMQQLREDLDRPGEWETASGMKWCFGGGYDGTGPGAAAPPGTTYTGQLKEPAGLSVGAVPGGGSFAAATYFWKVTAIDGNGETMGSNEATVAIALNGSATLNWSPVQGAQAYRVYRGTATNAEQFVATTAHGVTSYTDTGTVASGAIPTTNTTGQQQIAQQSYYWMYITGDVFTIPGELTTPATWEQTLDRLGNQVSLLAEQPWLAAVDCAKAAILVKTPSIP